MSRKKKNESAKKKSAKKQMEKLSKKQLKKQAKAVRKAVKKQEKATRKVAKKLAKSLAHADGKKAKGLAAKKIAVVRSPKAAKLAKAGAAKGDVKGDAAFKLNLGTCPCCSKHCPLSKPKCGKGRAVARKKRACLMGKAAA